MAFFLGANSSRFLLGTVDRLLRLYCQGGSGGAKNNGPSEDIRVATCRCLASLFSSCTDGVLAEVYSRQEENRYRMSQLLLEALRWLEEGRRVRPVAEACLALLESVLVLDEGKRGSSSEVPFRSLLTGYCLVFHQMLPGVSSKLMKLLKDGQVRVGQCRIFSDFFCICVSNSR